MKPALDDIIWYKVKQDMFNPLDHIRGAACKHSSIVYDTCRSLVYIPVWRGVVVSLAESTYSSIKETY